ncbi:phage tail protein [Paenibacillus melissococcoides]|uniref:Phage tail protein n=1 Tax=Paenibacillus melissococcoides TaxID=2912268 RepID=A0ABM9G9T8_9BACL|nr:phage tail protein [Paenibacillus melissococcoides]CAH8248815.1 phage tail protein [Paenibacillus melissococcoides]
MRDHIVAPTGEVIQEGTPISARNLNNIEEGIYQLSQRIDDVKVPAASLTQAGITQLSNATDSTDETKAATPKAVNEAMQAAVNAQGAIEAHTEDQVRHITAAERTAWNAKETTEGAQAKANQAESNAKSASLPRSGGTITGGLTVNGALTVQSRNIITELDSVKQSVVDGKGKVAGVINDKGGGPVSANSTFDQLAAAISGIPQAKGNLALTSTFFDMLGNYVGKGMFINKDNNFVLVKETTSGSPVKYQSELHEVSPNGTVVRAVHLGAPREFAASSLVVGDNVVLIVLSGSSKTYELYDHAGKLISKNNVDSSAPDYEVIAVTRDGSNTFIVDRGYRDRDPVRILNHAAVPYFTMPSGSVSAEEAVFLSKTKLYVARQSYSPIARKHTIITRNNLSFSYEMTDKSTSDSGVIQFLGAHAYR